MSNEEIKVYNFMKDEDFIIPLQIADILNVDFETDKGIKKVFEIIYSLINKGLIRKRNCIGIAYEIIR